MAITSISPTFGDPAGGTNVTITGEGFFPGSAVLFGDTEATNVVVVSPTEITCTTPAGVSGAVTVSVVAPGGKDIDIGDVTSYKDSPGANGESREFRLSAYGSGDLLLARSSITGLYEGNPATGNITFSASANAELVFKDASATGTIQFGAELRASGGVRAIATSEIQIGANADAVILPRVVTGIEYVSTVDSLTFTWDPALRADSYRARLYRDGVLVGEQTPVVVSAIFSGLEDGTEYVVEISGVNADGPGPSGVRAVITQYIAPTAPLNLRQTDQNYVAVKVEWDAPAEKVTFWESEVYVADPYELIHRGVLPQEPLEKFYGLPTAGKTYQWRIRSGNPGGLSAWAEIEISTPGVLIDSRLALLPAAYQEDYLFPDTWDGGTDFVADGVGDPQNVFLDPAISANEPKFVRTVFDQEGVGVGISMGSFTQINKLVIGNTDLHEEAVSIGIEMGDFTQYEAIISASASAEDGVSVGITIGDFTQYTNIFSYAHDEHEAISIGIVMGNFTSEPPA